MEHKNSYTSDGSIIWKVIWKYPINLNKNVMCDPQLPLLKIYPQETFTHFQNTQTKKIIIELPVILKKKGEEMAIPL